MLIPLSPTPAQTSYWRIVVNCIYLERITLSKYQSSINES